MTDIIKKSMTQKHRKGSPERMENALAEYIPDKSETILVQAHVSRDVAEAIRARIREKKLSWQEFMEGLFRFYLDQENQGK